MAEWQPIETAPKDGTTEILTYRKAGIQAVAIYWPHGDTEWCCVDGIHILNVTHWMPLPPPPTPVTDGVGPNDFVGLT